MKPLTIEELKALKVGDWVWSSRGEYIQCKRNYLDKDIFCAVSSIRDTIETFYYKYSDYGKTWLAWKNKEQAEAKGEIVELPCKIGDTVYTVTFAFMDGWVGNKMKSQSDWRKSNKVIKDKIDLYKFLISFEKGDGFLTELEAERHLAELKGE